jgi:hypothetical protein
MEVGEAAPRGSPPTGSSLRRRSGERAQRDQAPHDTCSGQTLRALTPQCHRLRPVVFAGGCEPAAAQAADHSAQVGSFERDPGDPPLFAALACVSTADPPLGPSLRRFGASPQGEASGCGSERSRVRRPGTAGPHGITSDLEEEQSPWKERTSVTRNGGQTTTNFVDGARPRSRSARDDSKDQRHALRAPRLSRVSVFAVFGVDQPRPIPR